MQLLLRWYLKPSRPKGLKPWKQKDQKAHKRANKKIKKHPNRSSKNQGNLLAFWQQAKRKERWLNI